MHVREEIVLTPLSIAGTQVPLRIGTVLGRTFFVWFRYAPWFLLIGIGILLGNSWANTWIYATYPRDMSGADWVMNNRVSALLPAAVSLFSNMFLYCLTVLLTKDALAGQKMRPWRQVLPALSGMGWPIVFGIAMWLIFRAGRIGTLEAMSPGGIGQINSTLTAIIGILIAIAFLAVGSLLIVTVPVMLQEKAGWRAPARSIALTKGYRWPVFGLVVVLMFLLAIVSVFAATAMGQTVPAISGLPGGAFLIRAMIVLVDAVFLTFLGVFATVLYGRLRDIKEGLGVDDPTDVFE